jgi:hypothetical protein
MIYPSLYTCHQIEQARREDERRDARLWRLLRQGRPGGCSRRVPRERRAIRESWVRSLLGSPSL